MNRGLAPILFGLALTGCISTPKPPPGWDFDHANCWLRDKSGYGVSVKGTNPSQAELFAEIRALSAQWRVPVEIIGGVMEQESLGFQYGGDGAVVHNRRECQTIFDGSRPEASAPPGLGLMQLTGSTARAFDVSRLITDWRYNLLAGVQVLDDKYRRMCAGLPPELQLALDRNRDILENWHFGVLAYNGMRANSPYPGRVLARIASPSAQLSGLFDPVVIASPEGVVPGFGMGQAAGRGTPFAVEHDGTWRLAAGAVSGPVHVTGQPWPADQPRMGTVFLWAKRPTD